MHIHIHVDIHIPVHVQGTHKFSAHKFSLPSAHRFSVDFPHIIPHIIFDGGLDIELGKAEAETGVNKGETKVKSVIKKNML